MSYIFTVSLTIAKYLALCGVSYLSYGILQSLNEWIGFGVALSFAIIMVMELGRDIIKFDNYRQRRKENEKV